MKRVTHRVSIASKTSYPLSFPGRRKNSAITPSSTTINNRAPKKPALPNCVVILLLLPNIALPRLLLNRVITVTAKRARTTGPSRRFEPELFWWVEGSTVRPIRFLTV